MDRATAVRKISKLIGKGFGYRIDDNAPTLEEREAAKPELAAASAEVSRLKALKDSRHEAILKADAEYQELFAALKAARDRHSKLTSMQFSHKVTVGNTINAGGIGFFSVMAEGDNWQEVVDKLTKKKAA